MSGFTDTAEPSSRLTPPKKPEEFSQGALLDLFNDASDLISPTYWITEAYNAVFGFNPLDEVTQWFAGDWESFVKCAEVWQNIGKACGDIANNLTSGNKALDATWNGHAADSAYVYFDELAKKLIQSGETLDSLADAYKYLAHAAYSAAEAIKGYLGGIIDGLIIVGIELAAGTLLSWTGAGALVGYGLAALEVTRILKMWADATETFGNAQAIVNGGVGTIEGLAAAVYSHLQDFPEVGGTYDNPAVA
ncbi:hypothetical protein [Streptomyces sp. SLBN-31]|uniref:hypothetical protein n=1 Tax=Streptomyces sp. SLBN-31 TaxID=2768444 RepID=UPI0011536D92|nr:hypothetical protein [Streptomyces sp. SLBN-31]TQJ85419.1 hypothetical protein FBY22_4194 [Streptomyces sp. SLBN-31]